MRTIYLSLVAEVKYIVLNETSTQEVTSIMYEGIAIMDRLISTTVIFYPYKNYQLEIKHSS